MMKNEAFLSLKKRLFEKLYSFLNDPQRDAVFSVNGNLLVLAGAGSGKTTVLVNRIAQILLYGDAYNDNNVKPEWLGEMPEMERLLKSGTTEEIREYLKKFAVSVPRPYNILCLTFTNKAAKEFKERLEKLLGESAGDIWAGTFHSICVRILRREIDKIGYASGFAIYDDDDSKKLINECMKELKIDDETLNVKFVRNEISRAKESFMLPDTYGATVGFDYRKKLVHQIYEKYQQGLKKADALDFDDLILQTIILFSTRPEVLLKYKEQFKYILADEYQDTNRSQSLLIEMIGADRGNICVVGDDDQSIYSFRGANVENILDFDNNFDGVKTIRLEQNYRSTKNILGAANAVIANNVGRKGKTLWTGGDEGTKVIVKKHYTQSEEATYLMNIIRHRVVYDGAKYSDFAILYRTNEQANALELIFSKSKVPYRIFGGTRFYDRKEIKDIMAYMNVINNPRDEIRLRRIVNVPKRGIGNTTVNNAAEIAAREGISLFEVFKNAVNYKEISKAAGNLRLFCDMIERFRVAANNTTLEDLFQMVIRETGYRDMLLEDELTRDKVGLIDELVSTAVLYEQESEVKSLESFLEQVALVSDIDNYDNDADAVAMMTMHSSKGLEFPVVFLPGFEEGLFPSQRSLDENNLEEERRLCYVAMTRARKELYILHTNTRLLYGRTSANRRSRFVDEIPSEFLDVEEVTRTLGNIRPAESKQSYNRSLNSFAKNTTKQYEYTYTPTPKQTAKLFEAGSKVNHRVFGVGIVIEAEPMGGDVLYTIDFETHGKRKLMGNLAKLESAE
ncbi:MAG: UvrD-helicase domain-containing protein [Clostridia bacterium]|nr:UvrD-helicase domain-containing protein [Clostridia bacterium]